MNCAKVCPKGLNPGKAIAKIKQCVSSQEACAQTHVPGCVFSMFSRADFFRLSVSRASGQFRA